MSDVVEVQNSEDFQEKVIQSDKPVLVDYWAEWVSGEPIAGTDAMQARWVAPVDLPAYKLWDETLRVINLSAKAR